MQQTTARSLIARIGALDWVAGAALFFACGFIAKAAWTTPYSWSLNNVSDLGNIHCQPRGDNRRYVCSPLHDVMNAGVIAEGVLSIIGLIMLGYLWKATFVSLSARGLIILAAAAVALVGFVAADLDENLQVLGALFITFLGNTGLLLAGRAMRTSQPRPIRLLAPIVGGVGLLATLLFFSGHYFGLGMGGMGGMERFAVFNLPVWTLAVGCYVLVSGAA